MTLFRIFALCTGMVFGCAAMALAQVTEPTRQVQAPPPTAPALEDYRLGVGGGFGGSKMGLAASVRIWSSNRVAFEFQASRYSDEFLGVRMGIIQFAPVVLFRLPAQSTDADVIVRPFVGGGLNVFRSTTSIDFPGWFAEKESDTSMGIQILGGTEVIFRDAPRFVLSIDIGYHSTGTLFDDISIGGIAYGLTAHWYIK